MDEEKIYEIEEICKTLASLVRLQILFFLKDHPNSLAKDISKSLNCNIKTLSQHIKKLHQSGMINRLNRGREVELSLNNKGNKIIDFINLYTKNSNKG